MPEKNTFQIKAVTNGIDFYEEIEFPASDEEIITACLNKLSEINIKQVAGIKLNGKVDPLNDSKRD